MNKLLSIILLASIAIAALFVFNNDADLVDNATYGTVCPLVVSANGSDAAFNAMLNDAKSSIGDDAKLNDLVIDSVDLMMERLEDDNQKNVVESICVRMVTGGKYSLVKFRK